MPEQLVNQIAAGEVVERPASVVKELLENSLDAQATRIEVDVEQGGIKSIRIRDNGHGIHKDDLVLSLSSHATSKIKDIDDLETVSSLGFRGEALPSIASVSRLTLTTRWQQAAEAWQLEASHGQGHEIQPAALNEGTTVEVRIKEIPSDTKNSKLLRISIPLHFNSKSTVYYLPESDILHNQ